MIAAILSALVLLMDAAPPASLSGKVVGADGTSVGGATVMVYSASLKKGAPTTLPTEYPECGKSSTTDAGSGSFAIDGLDSGKTYEFLVLSDTFRPLLLKKVDPARGQIHAKLTSIPGDVDPQLLVRGRVVDMNGNPMPAVKIEVDSYGDANSRTFGGESSVIDPMTYSNAKGEFTLVAKKAGLTFDLLLHSRDGAPMIARFGSGEDSRDVAMSTGAHITGRVVKDGQPLAGIKLNLVQKDRNSETFLDIASAYTDATGQFIFPHVHPDYAYDVAPTMKTLAGRGWVEPTAAQAAGEDATLDIGDMPLQSGVTIAGQLVTHSAPPDWRQAKLNLRRGDTWDDAFEISADKDGHFQFNNVGGIVELRVKLEGFHLSKENANADPFSVSYMIGRADENISDLKVQVDPGPAEQGSGNFNQPEWERLQASRLSGVESK